MTKTRTPERLQALSWILSDGLVYSWFRTTMLNESEVTAVVYTSSQDDEDFDERHEIHADDVARGLRMVREYFNGERELYKGQWDFYRRTKGEDWQPAKGTSDDYLYQLILFDRTNGAEGDYDAETADMVMQFAIFGEVRYG